MGPIGCPETSGRNYHFKLHNRPEEYSSQPAAYRGGGGLNPPPEIPKAPQNRAKLNPILKTVKNRLI